MVSASEKIGRYRQISTKATNDPMTIIIAGSTSESAAVMRVLTSSSKNSATLLSIAGSAPVDSPTSIISTASPGNMPEVLSEADGAAGVKKDGLPKKLWERFKSKIESLGEKTQSPDVAEERRKSGE